MKIGIVTNLFVLAVVVFFSITVYAGTYVVPDEYATIQEAVNAAWEIDESVGVKSTILVKPGLYVENIAFDNSNITIRGIPPVVIRPAIDDDTIYFSTGKNVSLINLKIEIREGYSGIKTFRSVLETDPDYTYSSGEEILIYRCDFKCAGMSDTAKGIEVREYEVDPRVVVVKNCSFALATAIYSYGGAVVVSGNDVTHGMTKCVGGYYVDCNEDLTISSMIEELLGLME